MGQPEFATHPSTVLCSGKPTGGTARLRGETAFLDAAGFPNPPAPQPSTVNHELAVASTKPPA